MTGIDILDLLGAFRTALAQCDGTEALRGERAAILGGWPQPQPTPAPVQPQLLPACRHLDAAFASGAAGPMAPLLQAAAPMRAALRWSYGYPSHPDDPSLPDNIAFCQIVGRRGLADDHRLHLGLTLLAPHTHYPLHSHPAIELYLVLAGVADWRVSGQSFAPQPPGTFILHETGIGHAMRTGAEPLLALYTWRGDLETAPVYIDEPA